MTQEFIAGIVLNQVEVLFNSMINTLIVVSPYVVAGIVVLALIGILSYHMTKKKS